MAMINTIVSSEQQNGVKNGAIKKSSITKSGRGLIVRVHDCISENGV